MHSKQIESMKMRQISSTNSYSPLICFAFFVCPYFSIFRSHTHTRACAYTRSLQRLVFQFPLRRSLTCDRVSGQWFSGELRLHYTQTAWTGLRVPSLVMSHKIFPQISESSRKYLPSSETATTASLAFCSSRKSVRDNVGDNCCEISQVEEFVGATS